MTSDAALADVRQFVALVASSISEWELPPAEVRNCTEAILQTLEQGERLGETQPSLAAATADAYALLLQMDVENRYITQPDSILRLRAIEGLNRTARMMAVIYQQSVPSEMLSILGTNLPWLIGNENLPPRSRVEAGRTYVELLSAIASREPDRKEEIKKLDREFGNHCRSRLNMLDPTKPYVTHNILALCFRLKADFARSVARISEPSFRNPPSRHSCYHWEAGKPARALQLYSC